MYNFIKEMAGICKIDESEFSCSSSGTVKKTPKGIPISMSYEKSCCGNDVYSNCNSKVVSECRNIDQITCKNNQTVESFVQEKLISSENHIGNSIDIQFPENFIWGTTTSSYQIEGGCKADEKGESVWDRYTHIPGRIYNNDTGDVACDHYHLYREDVKLLKRLRVKSYMFSINWTRIFPSGTGEPNQKGMDFYRNLVRELIENGIQPAVNLYHWETPQKLQDAGGWTNRDMVNHFEKYARYIFKELGDSVPIWTTFNEPWVSSFVSYWYGGHPPAMKDFSSALLAAHNILLAHGRVVRAFRETGLKGKIGISLNLNPIYPSTEAEQDLAAAKRYGEFLNEWFLSPLLKGNYPDGLVNWLSDKVVFPNIHEGDMESIHTPVDFIGINSYSSNSIMYAPDDWPLNTAIMNTGKEKTDSGWEIYPEGLYDLLMYLQKEYKGMKFIITENGAAFKDTLDNSGNIDDYARILFLHSHILQVQKAIRDGVNLIGYFVWSFLDNFEWNNGYSKRFGLVHVDYHTLKRTIKKSGYWYGEVIRNNGIKDLFEILY